MRSVLYPGCWCPPFSVARSGIQFEAIEMVAGDCGDAFPDHLSLVEQSDALSFIIYSLGRAL